MKFNAKPKGRPRGRHVVPRGIIGAKTAETLFLRTNRRAAKSEFISPREFRVFSTLRQHLHKGADSRLGGLYYFVRASLKGCVPTCDTGVFFFFFSP